MFKLDALIRPLMNVIKDNHLNKYTFYLVFEQKNSMFYHNFQFST